ncbi:uncharacterized protein LOC129610070 [Condylostylus longicornis]|uniref:uncharacterized protein LOC129610070 n=1 Tax=Condylostylus longicornis TaxID=2530218 RepID=UPI00244E39E7|nr:uncharacterized protein LOC129610070 [Condylostylus longicornis]
MFLKIINTLNSTSIRRIALRINNVRSYIPGIKPQRMNEQLYMKRDKMSQDYTIIYRAPMENYLVISKNVTTITATLISILAGYKYILGEKMTNISKEEQLGDLMIGDSDLIIFAAGFILITIILRVFISKYPLRIYRKGDTYVAVFQGQQPFQNPKLHFNKGEASESKPNSLNPWSESMYQLKNKNVILLTEYFKTPSELTDMMLPPVKKSL